MISTQSVCLREIWERELGGGGWTGALAVEPAPAWLTLGSKPASLRQTFFFFWYLPKCWGSCYNLLFVTAPSLLETEQLFFVEVMELRNIFFFFLQMKAHLLEADRQAVSLCLHSRPATPSERWRWFTQALYENTLHWAWMKHVPMRVLTVNHVSAAYG